MGQPFVNVNIRGKVVFEKAIVCLPPACVWVRLSDVSILDAPARNLAELRVIPTYYVPVEGVEFQLATNLQDASRIYVIAAHFSGEGVQQVRPGDMLTTQSIPIDRNSLQSYIDVPTRTVR